MTKSLVKDKVVQASVICNPKYARGVINAMQSAAYKYLASVKKYESEASVNFCKCDKCLFDCMQECECNLVGTTDYYGFKEREQEDDV